MNLSYSFRVRIFYCLFEIVCFMLPLSIVVALISMYIVVLLCQDVARKYTYFVIHPSLNPFLLQVFLLFFLCFFCMTITGFLWFLLSYYHWPLISYLAYLRSNYMIPIAYFIVLIYSDVPQWVCIGASDSLRQSGSSVYVSKKWRKSSHCWLSWTTTRRGKNCIELEFFFFEIFTIWSNFITWFVLQKTRPKTRNWEARSEINQVADQFPSFVGFW